MSIKYPLLYDKAWLEQKYVDEKLSSRAISELIGCGTTSVENGLKRFKIPTRSLVESHRKHPLLLDMVWLEQKYLEECLNTVEIGKLVGRSPGIVSEALKCFNISIRNRSESQIKFKELWDRSWLENKYLREKLGTPEIASILGCTSTQVLVSLKRFGITIRTSTEAHINYDELFDRQWLEEKYINNELSVADIADLIGCCHQSVSGALERFDIPTRGNKTIRYKELLDKEWLEGKYLKEGLCFREVSELIGCASSSVERALRHFCIPTRSRGEVQQCGRGHNQGNTLSEEGRKRLSERMKGNKYRLGIPHTDKTKGIMCKRRKGRVFSEETKRRISESKKGKKNPMYGVPPWHKGKKGVYSKETIEKIKEARKRQVFPRHHTKIERILIETFERNQLPIKYTGDSAFWIETPEMNINPDFIVEGKKIAIEANGEYTHYSLTNFKKRVSSGKASREKFLNGVGWKLVVFWETDILRDDSEAFVLSVLRRNGII